MILSEARQWVREAIAPHVEENYRLGDTLLTMTIESNRKFLADNLRLDDVPRLEQRSKFFIENHAEVATALYKEFDLQENTRVRNQAEIIDASKGVSYRAELMDSQASVQKISEQIGTGIGVDVIRDIIPIYRNSNICQIYNSASPASGWEVGIDYVLVTVVVSPEPLTNSDQPLRLKEEHEYYALKLAYADVMSTLIGDAKYKDVRVQILKELGLQK